MPVTRRRLSERPIPDIDGVVASARKKT